MRFTTTFNEVLSHRGSFLLMFQNSSDNMSADLANIDGIDDNIIKQLADLYIDFSKAFDKVPHSKLIGKLQNVGFGGKLLSLICSYLRERKQMVKK